jgi:hypothetical protein
MGCRQSQLQLKQNEKRKKKKESILTVVVKTLTLSHLRTMKKRRRKKVKRRWKPSGILLEQQLKAEGEVEESCGLLTFQLPVGQDPSPA